ncbi:MAG: hypothetical protein MUP76_11525 [Acidimicrobiia bacterium]|nr:hypothetical protein [Acidimicrobiia bacterium]
MHTELETWAPALRAFARPWAVERPIPRIRLLRIITLAILAEIAVLGIVLLFVVDLGAMAPVGWLYGWAGLTALSLPLGFYTRARRNEHMVRTANERDAFGFYRLRMLVGIAIAEVPVLAGFLISFPADSIIPYLAGLVVSLLRMAQYGPTGAAIVQMQGWFDEYQDPLDLAGILMEPAGGMD